MKTSSSRRPALLATALLAIGMLAGCMEEEQGRVLRQEKGVYQGAPDTPLSDERRDALRQRGNAQRF